MCRFRPALPTFPTTGEGHQMADKVTYYAVVDDLSSREQPAGVFRRTYFEAGGRRMRRSPGISYGNAPPH